VSLEHDLEDPLSIIIRYRENLKLWGFDECRPILCGERLHPFNFTTGHLPGVFECDFLVSDGEHCRGHFIIDK